jgi:hypothetical protein
MPSRRRRIGIDARSLGLSRPHASEDSHCRLPAFVARPWWLGPPTHVPRCLLRRAFTRIRTAEGRAGELSCVSARLARDRPRPIRSNRRLVGTASEPRGTGPAVVSSPARAMHASARHRVHRQAQPSASLEVWSPTALAGLRRVTLSRADADRPDDSRFGVVALPVVLPARALLVANSDSGGDRPCGFALRQARVEPLVCRTLERESSSRVAAIRASHRRAPCSAVMRAIRDA